MRSNSKIGGRPSKDVVEARERSAERPVRSPARIISAGGQPAWAVAEYFGYPLLMFAATPLFLRHLGAEVYGQWMLLLTLNGLGGLAGMGMGSAATREVAAQLGVNDAAGAAASAENCLAVTLLASASVAAMILIGVAVSPLGWLGRIGDPAVLRFIAVGGSAMIALEQIDTVFAGTIRGYERYDVSAKVELASKLAIVLAACALAVTIASLPAIVASTIVLMIGRSAIKAVIAAKLLNVRILRPRWDRDRVAEVFSFGKWTWVQSMGAALFASADRFLVGGMMGAAALAHYSVCVQLAQQVQTLPAAGAQVLMPRISRMVSSGTSVHRLSIRLTTAVAGFAMTLALILAITGSHIVQAWVGPHIAMETAASMSLLAFAYAILGANVVPHYVLLGLGKARLVALISLAGGVVAIGLAWRLIPIMGLTGAAIGRIGYGLVISTNVPAMLLSRGSLPPRQSGRTDAQVSPRNLREEP